MAVPNPGHLGLGRRVYVYADNHIARRLYESLGYLETARQLHKELPGE